MDENLVKIIKKEKERYLEDENDNYLRFSSFNVKVKVEDGSDDCLQDVLAEDEEETLNCDNIKQEMQPCSICNAYFIDSKSLYKHNLIHLKVPLKRLKLFMYQASPSIFQTKEQSRNITNAKTDKTINNSNLITRTLHKCGTCNKLMKYKHWFEHIRNVHGHTEVQCDICKKFFKCKKYLMRHIIHVHDRNRPPWRITTLKTPIQCPKCPTKLKSNYAYKTHMQNCHSEEKFECSICKSVLKCKSYLEVHMKRVHYDDGKKHRCDICGKVFKSPRYLRVHTKNIH